MQAFGFPPAKRAKGAGGKAVGNAAGMAFNPGFGGQGAGMGEVRFDSNPSAMKAVGMLNGSNMLGSTVSVMLDPNSKDGTKIIVQGVPAGAEWQELKDHFAGAGTILHASVAGAKKHGPKKTGEIRYDDAASAQQAMAVLQGSMMEDSQITIQLDPLSKDQTKLIVTGVPAGAGFQQLKDHFAQAGMVVTYAGFRAGANDAVVGEVRYEDPSNAMKALQMLNGSMLSGTKIFIQADPHSKDGSKIVVQGLTAATQWQELKNHFQAVGPVVFAQLVSAKKGAGKGKGGMMAMGNGGMNMGGGMGMGGMDPMMMQQMMMQMMPQMMMAMKGGGGMQAMGGGGGFGKGNGRGNVFF